MLGISVVESFLVSLCQSKLWFRACRTTFIKETESSEEKLPMQGFSPTEMGNKVNARPPGSLFSSATSQASTLAIGWSTPWPFDRVLLTLGLSHFYETSRFPQFPGLAQPSWLSPSPRLTQPSQLSQPYREGISPPACLLSGAHLSPNSNPTLCPNPPIAH